MPYVLLCCNPGHPERSEGSPGNDGSSIQELPSASIGMTWVVVFFLMFFSWAFSATAAQPLLLEKSSLPELVKKFQMPFSGKERKFLFAHENSLQLVRQHTDAEKVTHLRMQQYYAGFPVFGGYVILHTKNSPPISSLAYSSGTQVNGLVYQGLKAELGSVPVSFLKKAPLALQQFKSQFVSQKLSEEQITPLVYVDTQYQAHWAYKVSVLRRDGEEFPERPTAIIDALTNQILVQWNDLKAEKVAVQGRGFGGNKRSGIFQYGQKLPFLELTRDTIESLCFMENAEAKVVDLGHQYELKNKTMQFFCRLEEANPTEGIVYTGYTADGYDRENGGASPTNDALYAAQVVKRMYREAYGVEVLSNSDGSPKQLLVRVHYGESFVGIYWDGEGITLGDGDSTYYPLVSVGVIAHEASHGFTSQQAGLEYFGQSGGINEAFSDMAAQAAEFYAFGKSSWQIACDLVKEESEVTACRYMDKPSRDGESIDNALYYHEGLDPHYSSGVYNRLFYLLSNQPLWDVPKAFRVMIKANRDYWTPYTTFEAAACGLISATQDLGYSVEGVKDSLDQVFIQHAHC